MTWPTHPLNAPPIILGHLVRERRIAAGLSLREMAKRSGVSVVDLGKVERGLLAPHDGDLSAMFLAMRNATEGGS